MHVVTSCVAAHAPVCGGAVVGALERLRQITSSVREVALRSYAVDSR